MDADPVVVVGAGQAGLQLAESLRKGGHEGAITLIGEEPFPPYQRPPLSKGFLAGDMDEARLFLRPAVFYPEHGIALRPGVKVTRILREKRIITLGNGESVPYGALVLATGMRPRRLAVEGVEQDGIHSLRTLADSRRLSFALACAKRLVIIGGGYIGLEVAAIARQRGIDTTIVHRSGRLLSRSASGAASNCLAAFHVRHGTRLWLGARPVAFFGKERVEAVAVEESASGRTRELPADLVLVGIGGTPSVALARDAGLAVARGIVTDEYCRTEDKSVFAIGDVAEFPTSRYGVIQLESVQNARDSARACAATLCGTPTRYDPVPWFWSDQHDAAFQAAGIAAGATGTVARIGDAPSSCAWFHYREEKLVAVEAVNMPHAYMMGRRWMERGVSPDPAQIADPCADIKAIGARENP